MIQLSSDQKLKIFDNIYQKLKIFDNIYQKLKIGHK